MWMSISPFAILFQSTPSGGKATWKIEEIPHQELILFQSTPSGGKATCAHRRDDADRRCFNPRLPGGRRHETVVQLLVKELVSIHAFRGEGDRKAKVYRSATSCFNPRLPGGRRPAVAARNYTVRARFNPRLPGGRRLDAGSSSFACASVSIHAFRGEGDRTQPPTSTRRPGFNPRLPGGRRQAEAIARKYYKYVSIHAFRGEGDAFEMSTTRVVSGFQSTPSGGKATLTVLSDLHAAAVSIHAFRGEGDKRQGRASMRRCCFNPRLPGGRRPSGCCRCIFTPKFQSTPSGGKATFFASPTGVPP